MPEANEVLVSVVCTVLAAQLRGTTVVGFLLGHAHAHQLWHGILQLKSGHMAQIVYFDDINRCLVAVCKVGSEKTSLFRFSMPEGMTEPVDPSKASFSVSVRQKAEQQAPN